jgi:hypothetical protein
MVLVAAAVCPHPPLLVPDVATGAAGELDDLRAACARAVAALVTARPDVLVAVGGQRPDEPVGRGFSAYGLELDLDVGTDLPLSLLVGAWLLRETDADVRTQWQPVPAALPAQECAALGARLSSGPQRVALLVMGDSSARLGVQPPRGEHPEAAAFHAGVATALRDADSASLLALTSGRADDLAVAGRAAWQVLAGAAGERRYTGRVLYDGAPYGVGYLVATWSP